VKNGAEKEKNTPEAGNTLAYVHEEKKTCDSCLGDVFFAFACITVEATSVETLCTLARGYPFRREKHKTCELSQHRQRSIWQPLVKNGAEKEKNTPEAGNTLAYVHEEKKTCDSCLGDVFCICAMVSVPLKSLQKNGGRNLHFNICGNRCTHVGKKPSQIATLQQV